MFKVRVHTIVGVGEAVAFIAQFGFDGVGIVCSDDYRCAIPARPSRAQLDNLRLLAEDFGLAIANVVPYAKELNSLVETRRS